MKDINKLKDYRKKYKRYYNIEFDNDFVVHHLDFDRNNNDISNLLLLPKDLHQRYHFYLQSLNDRDWKKGKLEVSTRIDEHRFNLYSDQMLFGLIETIKECEMWLAYKERLDYEKEHQELLKRWEHGNI